MNLNYDEMMELCVSKKELRAKIEYVDNVSVTIFSYMVCLTDTFDTELAKEFRGTCFLTESKKLISRPFPKFFNVGEKEDTQENCIDWNNINFYEKFDGSMAVPVLINNKIFWKTKNSFFSDVAIKIQNFYENNASSVYGHKNLKRILKRFTPIFEYVAPHNRIVLEYEKEELVYLGHRSLEDGNYVPTSPSKTVSKDEIKAMKGIEGFVIHDGCNLYKMKTDEYFEHHKIVSDFNPKAIIKASLDETIDDILAIVKQLGFTLRFYQIQELRDETLKEKLKINNEVQVAWNSVQPFKNDRKEFAQKVNETIRKEIKVFMFLIIDRKNHIDKIDKLVYDTVYARYKPTIEGKSP